jgi:deoxyadenosine/deoxycytidine kinase
MLTSELIARVKSLYNEKNIAKENKVLSDRHIYNKLITSRARVISQELDRYKHIAQECYQTLSVSLTYSNMIYDTNTQILKSVNKIPSIITERNKPVIQSVSNINGTLQLYPVSQENTKYTDYNKYTGKKLYYYFIDNYLHIKNSDNLGIVIITAVFFNPLDIPNTLPFPDREFPIDGSLVDSIVSLTLEELLLASNKKNNAE